MHIIAHNNNDLFKKATLAIREHGEESSSGNDQVNTDGTRFIEGFVATVTDPTDRWLNIKGRNCSPIAAIGETFWVLSGRNDIGFLSQVLPRAANFSDDGVTWRGAYGPRLYSNGQLDSVISRLRKNHNTRHAYLTIYDPALDSDQGLAATSLTGDPVTKDMICNFALLFSIKDNRLNMTVTNRSQDVLWGMSSINFIEFSIIQEIVARLVGVEMGVYRLFSNNIHYYNNDISQKQLSQVTAETIVHADPCPTPIVIKSLRDQDDIKNLFKTVLTMVEAKLPFEENVLPFLKFWGADTGLIRDMSYALWCRLNGTLINVNNLQCGSLISAICNSPIDQKYVDRESLEGCGGPV